MLNRRIAAFLLAASIAVPFAGQNAPVLAADGAGSPRIVCLGDSLTEGYSLSPEQAWPALLEQSLRKRSWPDVQVVNAGVSGSTSASAVSRLTWQLRTKPDVLVLALGANDGLRGIDPAETKKNLGAAIDLAKTNGITVLLAGMKLPPNYGNAFTASYEATFQSLASEKNVKLIPFLLEGVAADPALNLSDGLHPNAAGYVIVARLVEQYLVPVLESLKPADAGK